jgi:hypothetical protein
MDQELERMLIADCFAMPMEARPIQLVASSSGITETIIIMNTYQVMVLFYVIPYLLLTLGRGYPKSQTFRFGAGSMIL